MALPAPALRQPKAVSTTLRANLRNKFLSGDTNYVIVTLKNDTKLVIASDAYHGIITEEEMYKCVFCAAAIDLDRTCLEMHKCSSKHKLAMLQVSYIVSFNDHLMRQMNNNETYCMICNVLLAPYSVVRHTNNDAHLEEYNKAYARGLEYKPCI